MHNVVIPSDQSFCPALQISHPLHLFVASTSISFVYFIHFAICFDERHSKHCYSSSIEMKNGWTHQRQLRLLFIIAERRQICHTFHYSSTWFFSLCTDILYIRAIAIRSSSKSTPFIYCNSAAKMCIFGYIASGMCMDGKESIWSGF